MNAAYKWRGLGIIDVVDMVQTASLTHLISVRFEIILFTLHLLNGQVHIFSGIRVDVNNLVQLDLDILYLKKKKKKKKRDQARQNVT